MKWMLKVETVGPRPTAMFSGAKEIANILEMLAAKFRECKNESPVSILYWMGERLLMISITQEDETDEGGGI